MSEPISPDPRDILDAFKRDVAGQAAQNAQAGAVNRALYNARESQYNRPNLAQSGSFTQPGSSSKRK